MKILFKVCVRRGISLLFLYVVCLYTYRLFVTRQQPDQINLINYFKEGKNSTRNGDSVISENGVMGAVSLNLLKFPAISHHFQTNSKNPCFYVEKNSSKPEKHRQKVRNNHKELRCLPYFLLIGFSKCATSDLWKRLTQHPQIVGPRRKEPHYWDMWKSVSNSNIPIGRNA